jgi:thimet oligopeptidase
VRSYHAILLAGSCLLASTAIAAPATIPQILTEAPTAAQIKQRCDLYVARSTAMRKGIETSSGAPGVESTLKSFDRLLHLLVSANIESSFYREVSATAASRSAGEKCEVRIGSEFNKLTLSRPIYERIKAIKAPSDDVATQRYLARVLGDFERSGVALDTAGRAKAQTLSDEVSELATTFEANIPKGQRTITATPVELDGLPQDFIDGHKPGPDGKVTLRTDYTDYLPVLTYAKSSALRERFYREFSQRAYPQNEAVLRDLINKRDELAHLVGRPNYATLNFEDRMLNTPEKVQSLIDQMSAAAKPTAERDYAKKLAALQQLQPGATKVEPWDNLYVETLVQKQSYGYDRQQARKYFAYDNVRDGILKLTEDMFGVDIRPWKTPKMGQTRRSL